MPDAPSRVLAALSGAVLAVGLCACAPEAPETPPEQPVDRVLLSPTTDPSTSQTVTWRAAGAEEAFLEIGPEDGSAEPTRVRGQATGGEEPGSTFAATATVLEPDTAYRYRIVAGVGDGDASGGGDGGEGGEGSDTGGAVSDWRTFTTAAEGAEPFGFLYFGDIQNDITAEAAPVIRAGLEAAPDAELAVHSGDLVDSANSGSEWDEWFAAFGPATGSMNHVATPGNHEYDDGLSEHWVPQFPGAGNGPDQGADLAETAYHTDYQGVRFVVLNSNYREVPRDEAGRWLDTQRRWLERVLADNPHEWTVVTFHHPVFSADPDRDNEPLREAWLPVLEEYDVDLVLQGHDHSYTRGNMTEHRTGDPDTHTGPVHVVAVTGPKTYDAAEDNWTDNGAEVRVQRTDTQTFQTVSVDGDTLEYRSRTAEGRVVDSFTIVKDGDGRRVTDGS
ncbi:purple acid phosphatase family protein [Nocardiopsis deserti]|uniref:purple acid phosphatase family protein n=1 Tax=Nocardiopsis deserti TaxID=2605988 RepID=UPI0012391EBF|nr:metallophosphoesterase family protein [Nocardiopsis deserti]